MIYTEEKMETMVPPAEEKEEDVVVVEEDVVEEEGEDTMPQTTDKIEKKMPSPEQPKEKKEEVLNLNNEVVKMRKEVKRVKTLVLRKLMRQISALKKKKGNETNMERNQNRAARLLKEIHVMKTLLPDLVTKTALVKKLDFDLVCKDPKSTISDRAIARIATHHQFSKKIEAIRAAVQAFKEERMKGGKQGKKGGKAQKQVGKVTPESTDSNQGGGERKDKEEEAVAEAEAAVEAAVEQKEMMDNEERDCNLKESETPTVDEPSEKDQEKATPSAQPTDLQNKEMPESPETKSVRTASTKNAEVNPVKDAPQSKAANKKPNLKPAPKEHQKKEADEESDLEPSDDEEKEYFDDSTEERFHKQSSQSEESDGDDDFFLGKVSRFKKKKSIEGEKKKKETEAKSDSTDLLKTSDQGRLDERECRLNAEVTKLQTVFCSTLSSSNPGRGKQGRGGRGKSMNDFRGRGRQRGGGPDGSSKFQKQNRQPEGKPGLSNSKSDHESEGKGVAFAGRGRGRGRGQGRGRGDVARQQDRKGQGVFSHQAPQQALHPSWEASKKRKEQQGQILAFQGKKIKFGDDD